ncbi:MAG TPA: hypothetical protein VLK84_12110 [Longimicrobium sp.]|nr:hypothetical protein [Longimicrobium sp.]
MWPVVLLFSVFWIADFRYKRYTWAQSFATLCVALVVLVPLAAFTPGWLWKTVLMAFMTYPWWLTLVLATRTPVGRETPLRAWEPGEEDGVGPEMAALMEQHAAAVEREGLVRIGLYRGDMPSPAMPTLVVVLESPDGTELVTVMGVLNHILPGTESEVRYTHLSTTVSMVYADGRRLAFTNTELTTPSAPGTVLESFTSVDDPARLLRVARAYAARRYGTAPRVPVRGEASVPEYSAERHRASVRAMTDRGLYRRRADGNWYPTLRGALVMGWGLLFPFRQIGGLRRRMRERRILRELGMEAAAAAPFPRPHTRHPFDVQCVAAVAIALLLILLD